MPLTDAKIRTTKPSEAVQKLPDGGGLYLEIHPNGRRTWRLRYWIAKKEARATLGQYPAMSLQQARLERERLKSQIRDGVSPTEERRREKACRRAHAGDTLEAVAEDWVTMMAPVWSPKTLSDTRKLLHHNAYPAMGQRPIRDIKPIDVLDILFAIRDRGAPSLALQLRSVLSRVFRHGIVTLRCDGDPASLVQGAINAPSVNHARALSPAEIARVLASFQSPAVNRVTAIAGEILLRTFVRAKELRFAEWREFEGGLWVIPPERMKVKGRGRKAHIVPLSRQALALVEELRRINGHRGMPFQIGKTSPISDNTINHAIERFGYIGERVTGHDFRSTAATWLYENGYPGDLIEMQLAHLDRNVTRRSYNHAERLDERRAMVQAYSDYLDSTRPHDGPVSARPSTG